MKKFLMMVSVAIMTVVNMNAQDETLTSFMFQATALGMEFGGEQFRGFVEAGVGEKGMLCAGLRYKF